MPQIIYWAGAILTITGALFALVKLGGGVFRTSKKWDDFLEDWHGTPARPGRPAVPGVMQRLVELEDGLRTVSHEMFPNSGLSLRDAVNRAETDLREIRERVSGVEVTR